MSKQQAGLAAPMKGTLAAAAAGLGRVEDDEDLKLDLGNHLNITSTHDVELTDLNGSWLKSDFSIDFDIIFQMIWSNSYKMTLSEMIC
jgi:hypothetical protein